MGRPRLNIVKIHVLLKLLHTKMQLDMWHISKFLSFPTEMRDDETSEKEVLSNFKSVSTT